ncbi:PREDICTED: intersectin-1-like, partial [Priapulus caudatus]|uniref:Intersectin-1-like n=1 Tax=Priapulus caudatus TaxID=37621 RepID=A0ABM1F592_PRICU
AASREQATVLAPFVPTGVDQLPLAMGAVVTVLKKSPNGWWQGEIPVTEQVLALFDYTAQNSDELSFSQGSVINVVNKQDPDWWMGEVNGNQGLFPSNYVQSLNDAQVQGRGTSPVPAQYTRVTNLKKDAATGGGGPKSFRSSLDNLLDDFWGSPGGAGVTRAQPERSKSADVWATDFGTKKAGGGAAWRPALRWR